MEKQIPAWAMRTVGTDDFDAVRAAHRRGTLRIEWPEEPVLRGWAKHREWPVPWFGFASAFLARMLADPESFGLALAESGIKMELPREDCTISAQTLEKLDALYKTRSAEGRPTSWGFLVEELREIRRAVEAGLEIQIEGGPLLRSWQDFYSWAHGRYHMLEDGSDHWIGDDRS